MAGTPPQRNWLICLALSIGATTSLARAQNPGPAPELDFDLPGDSAVSLDAESDFELDDVDFEGNPAASAFSWWPEDLVFAPIPGYSPQLGWTIKAAAGYFLEPRTETTAAPSSIGGLAMVAENGSYGYGAGARLHLLDDTLRVNMGAGYGDIRYRYYGTGKDGLDSGFSVGIRQQAPLYQLSATYRVWSRLYLGLGYLNGQVDTMLQKALPNLPPGFDPRFSLDIGAYSIPMQFDSRDHEQFPRNGWLIDSKATFYRVSAGSDFDADVWALSVNRYLPVRNRDVLALRARIRTASEDAPFFLLSTLGGSKDLRGYPSGRYRDRMMYALQGEYRWHFSERWIFTGFLGFGEVMDSLREAGSDYLPAAGLGARFVLSTKHRVGISADVAVGNDGAEVYLGVGEAF